jgi:type IV pilus assembly protein PilW
MKTLAHLRGFSLIELMVGIALGLLLLIGLTAMFVASSRSFSETERASRQIENGRYALDLLSEDIRHAGFYGEASTFGALAPVGAPPDPCSTTLATLRTALPVPVQGVDFVPGNADPSGKLPSCIPDHVAGTDVLVIRRARTTSIPAASAVANGLYTQINFCPADTPTSFQLASSGFTLTQSDCVTASPIRQFMTNIYFISPCSIGTGTGGACQVSDPLLPTLKRMELRPAGWTVVPLVEGIENLQLEYGLDTDAPPTARQIVTRLRPQTPAPRGRQRSPFAFTCSRGTSTRRAASSIPRATGSGRTPTAPTTPSRPVAHSSGTSSPGLVRVLNVSQRNEPIFGW